MHSRLAALVAAGVLAIAGLATGTAHADPTPAPTVTLTPTPTVSHAAKCGTVTITATNGTQTPGLRLYYRADHRWPASVAVAVSGDTVKTLSFEEDSGVHWVRYRLSGNPQWSGPVRVVSDCRPNYERADAPTVVQPECGATLGKLVIPSDRGVTYRVSRDGGPYRVARADTYDVRPGVYRVRAYVMPGHRLVGERSWRLVIEAAEACPTPTPTPTVTVTPTVDPTPEPTPTETVTEEPEPTPTVTQTVTDRRTVVVRDYLPVRIDTGLGGLAK